MTRRGKLGRLAAAVAVLGGLVAGCSSSPPPELERRAVPPPVASDPAKPCTTGGERRRGGAEAVAEARRPGRWARSWTAATNTIRITSGTGITLERLSKAIGNPAALKELAPGEWLAGANIEINKGASVTLSPPDVSWLKLRSVGPNFANVKVFGGALAVNGVCISSWDDTKQQVDTNPADGRGFLLARDGGQMTVDKSQLAYLGYGDPSRTGCRGAPRAAVATSPTATSHTCTSGCTRSASAACRSRTTTCTTTCCTASTRTPDRTT